MKIGILKEIMNNEFRVGITPAGVKALITLNHEVFIEENAGIKSGFNDTDYQKVGGKILKTPQEICAISQMIIKVKEPVPSEFKLLKKEHILFSFLDLAWNSELAEGLIASGCIAIAPETITNDKNKLPVLIPMSQVAGRMAIQVGMNYLQTNHGGSGVLLSGIPGIVSPGKVLIIGGGVVGENAAYIAHGIGAEVTVLDSSPARLKELLAIHSDNFKIQLSTPEVIAELIQEADLVVGAAFVVGTITDTIITKKMIKTMKKGSVLVDVSIDLGGCAETSKQTIHDDPIYKVDGVIHYCVANMPGVVARTSTIALTNATLPFILEIANKGWKIACRENKHLKAGLNVIKGQIVYEEIAKSLKLKYTPADQLL